MYSSEIPPVILYTEELPPNDVYIGLYGPETPGTTIAQEFIGTASRILDKLVIRDDEGVPKTANNVSYENLQSVQLRRISRGRNLPHSTGYKREIEDTLKMMFTSEGTSSPFRLLVMRDVRREFISGERQEARVSLGFYRQEKTRVPDAAFEFDLETARDQLSVPFADAPIELTHPLQRPRFADIDAQAPGVIDDIVDTLRMAETASERELTELQARNLTLTAGSGRRAPRNDPHDYSQKSFIEKLFPIPVRSS
ncbi:MAG: hypothetical protein JWL89_114 [Candidatus Saccharibacteria bacterium]|nr:hypothetical protein [Candidatus Saccharibacteria bacterium]